MGSNPTPSEGSSETSFLAGSLSDLKNLITLFTMPPFFFYLHELRARTLYLLFSWMMTSSLIYVCVQDFFFLTAGCGAQSGVSSTKMLSALIAVDIPEIFVNFFLGSVLGGLFFVFPYLLYQVWCFLVPSFRQSEKVLARSFLFGSFLWVYGVAWAVTSFLFPFFFDFFLSFGQNIIEPQLRLQGFVSFFLQILQLTYFFSSLPLLLHFSLWSQWVSVYDLFRHRRSLYLVSLLISALLSPPDFVSQFSFWFCLLFLFEISLCFHLIHSELENHRVSYGLYDQQIIGSYKLRSSNSRG